MILFQPKKFATPLTYQLARAIMAAEDAGLVLTETAEAEVVNDCVRLTDHAWPGFIICTPRFQLLGESECASCGKVIVHESVDDLIDFAGRGCECRE